MRHLKCAPKVNTIARYETSMPEMVALAKKKLASVGRRVAEPRCDVFLSYCRVNSRAAVERGTPLKSRDSLGWADPRALKQFLAERGYSVWVDFERVGSHRTLFEDIAEGKCQLAFAWELGAFVVWQVPNYTFELNVCLSVRLVNLVGLVFNKSLQFLF